MHQDEFKKQLVERYINNAATEQELEVFFHLLQQGELDEYISDAMFQEEMEPVVKKVAPAKKIALLVGMAAASVLLIVIAALFLRQPQTVKKTIVKKEMAPAETEIIAGGNKAVLTLADGSRLILDSATNGTLTNQGGVTVKKLEDGQLTYDEAGKPAQEVVYNTISTPRGGQYQITLADGTKVWLNAESHLKFPASFTGKQRRVEVKGEAYFEVAKNAAKPFFVSDGSAEVQVLGTHFNFNAYADEGNVLITLLEGSVRVSEAARDGHSVVISPNQQAKVLTGNKAPITVGKADVEKVIAWKNGYFAFQNANIKAIMKQLARWYNIEVIYEGEVPEVTFSGAIDRELTLNQVLTIMDETRINHQIIGNKLIIKN